ncbi:hypothetical protein EYF80_050391 [Liparis tanakae]|uniref:Uncharacterized protein n=1 Tax=Liparis tanakae TaxID=230148 RepID=A0A4Z2FDY3_9TELE|nr:hypothetical protein EYF80_050391 [Liparis tanakae]
MANSRSSSRVLVPVRKAFCRAGEAGASAVRLTVCPGGRWRYSLVLPRILMTASKPIFRVKYLFRSFWKHST